MLQDLYSVFIWFIKYTCYCIKYYSVTMLQDLYAVFIWFYQIHMLLYNCSFHIPHIHGYVCQNYFSN